MATVVIIFNSWSQSWSQSVFPSSCLSFNQFKLLQFDKKCLTLNLYDTGSLSRVLSVMGKGIRAMARTTTTPNKGQAGSIHSTPLPQFGATPDYPSPRGQPKRKAPEHELSPATKSHKRGFESTFTPKMRTRSFSVKRFKRKKSEGKLPKETFVTHTKLSCTPHQRTPMSQTLPTAMPVLASISNLHITPLQLKV